MPRPIQKTPRGHRRMALLATVAALAAAPALAQTVTQAPPNDPTMAPWMTAPEAGGTAGGPATGVPAGAASGPTGQTRQGIQQPPGPNTPAATSTATSADHFGGSPDSDTDATESLGLIQGAWNNPRAHMGQGQSSPGVKIVDWSPTSMPIVVNMRAQILTLLNMPKDEEIDRIVFNDTNTFTALISPDRHSAQIKAKNAGVDGNAVVIGKSGNNYPLYFRTTSYRSDRIPDMTVIVRVRGMSSSPEVDGAAADTGGGTYGGAGSSGSTSDEARARAVSSTRYDDDPTARLTMRPRAEMTKPGQDYSARALTGPGRLRTDLEIKVARATDSIIAPVAAWRNDRFTYLDYGPRAASMNTWPAASIVIDGVDAPIGSRVSGPNRSVMIIEGIGNITLTSGSHVVCIVTRLVDNDPRHPEVDEPYRNHAHPGDQAVDVLRPATRATPPLTGPRPDDYVTPQKQEAAAAMPARMEPPVTRQVMQPTPTPAMQPASGAPGTRIVAGPYARGAATKAAFEIRAGLDGSLPAMAAAVDRPDGTGNVQAATSSAGAADSLCESIRRNGHACKTY